MDAQILREIPLNQIHAKNNYRKTFNDKSLKELAASIKDLCLGPELLWSQFNANFGINKLVIELCVVIIDSEDFRLIHDAPGRISIRPVEEE